MNRLFMLGIRIAVDVKLLSRHKIPDFYWISDNKSSVFPLIQKFERKY